MTKVKMISGGVVGILVIVYVLYSFLSGDKQNQLERLGVTYLDGEYKVTFASDSHVQSWIIDNGKVTSEPEKGYYFFWAKNAAGKKVYVQTPINRTYIEGR